MVTINYFQDPTGCPQIINATCVGEWLLSEFGETGIPDGLRVYKGHCSATTDVSGNIDELTSNEGSFEVCIMPGTPIQIVWALVVVIVAMVVVLSMYKPPSMANRQQGSSTNALSSRTNTPRPNQRIVDIRGSVTGHMPDMLMVPYKVFESNIETEYSFMCVGVGNYGIRDVKDGSTPVRDIQSSGAMFYAPGSIPGHGAPFMTVGKSFNSVLYNVTRSNEIDGIALKAPNAGLMPGVTMTPTPGGGISADIGETSFTFYDVVGIDDEVLIEFDYLVLDGVYNVYYAGVSKPTQTYRIQKYSGIHKVTHVESTYISTDETTWPSDGANWINGLPANGTEWKAIITRTDGSVFTGVVIGSVPDDQLGHTSAVAFDVSGASSVSTISAVIPSGVSDVWINLIAQNGVYKEDSKDVTTLSINIDINIHETIDGVATGNVLSRTVTMNGVSKDQVGVTYKLTVPYYSSYVSVRRITPDDLSFKGNVVDEIKWRDLYSVTENTQSSFGNVTTVHSIRRATENATSGRDSKFNITAIRDNVDRISDVVQAMALDPFFGRLTLDQIDMDGLRMVEQQIVSYFYGNADSVRIGYAFDDASVSFEEALSMLCDAINIVTYRMGGVIKFKFERSQPTSAMQFTHRSKWPKTDVRTRMFKSEKEFDGIELTYRDEKTTAELTIAIPPSGVALSPKRIELAGCITKFAATIRARREYNKLVYSKISQSFESFGIARTLLPHTRIDVTDGTIGPFYDGEVLGQSGLRVRLSQSVDFIVGKQHSIVVSNRNGSIEGISVYEVPGDKFSVILSREPSEPLFVGYLEARTQYNFGSDDNLSAVSMLVQSVTPNITNGEERILVRAINYDSRYYSGDSQPVT